MGFDPKLIEAANRAEVTAILIRSGYRVLSPEADIDGGDMFLMRTSDRVMLVAQLKGRPACHDKYRGKDIHMLFPAPATAPLRRDWYLMPHDPLFDFAKGVYKPDKEFKERHWPKMTSELQGCLDKHAIRFQPKFAADTVKAEDGN
ncbi:MAG: hypothetical protein NT133_17265 [Alphaproteobacteria bacterium]|nr:hypothetical protein [Alphaproteobacteria bacterium]